MFVVLTGLTGNTGNGNKSDYLTPANYLGDTTIMHVINIPALAESLHKQLATIGQAITLQTLKQNVSDSFIGSEIIYDDIKVANGKLHKLLSAEALTVKRTVLLDMVAKAIGFENHHSLKHSQEKDISIKDLLNFAGADHLLSKFFTMKETISQELQKNGMRFDKFKVNVSTNKIELILYTPTSYMHSKLQQDMNKFFRSNGFKPYKDKLEFLWGYSASDPVPAMGIINRFHAFFRPLWEQGKTNIDVSSVSGSILPLSYNDIRNIDDLIIVDGYSTDMPFNTVDDALNCALWSKSNRIWIDLVQILLNIPQKEREYSKTDGIPMMSIIDIENYNRENELRELKSSNPKQVLRQYKDKTFLFKVDEFYMPYIRNFELRMGRDIGSLMRDVVVQFVDKHIERINTEDFSISDNPDSLMESLCPILSGKSHDELLDNDDVATDHHTRKAIQVIVYEIIDHIRLIEDASKH